MRPRTDYDFCLYSSLNSALLTRKPQEIWEITQKFRFSCNPQQTSKNVNFISTHITLSLNTESKTKVDSTKWQTLTMNN